MNKIPFFLILFIAFSGFIYSTEVPPPIEWGEIPRADLEMKSFTEDTNATAVILCDYGEAYFNDELDIIYKKHIRIKILNQKGYDWGTHKVYIDREDNVQRIDDIEGITYILNPDGKIEEFELDDDDIFEEEITEDRVLYKFTMPNLQPGCIIEIRYNITSNSLAYLPDWKFQYSEPVRWSEYRVCSPQAISYAYVSAGVEPWEIAEKEEITSYFSGQAATLLGTKNPKCWQYRWAIKNVPALRDEPFVTTVDDYRTELKVQLAGYALAGVGKKLILNTWDSLVERLVEHEKFYEVIDDTREVKRIALEITNGLTSEEDKMKAIYKWVSNSIVLDPLGWIFSEKDVDDIIEQKKGTCAETSFLLISMLKAVGIQSHPILLSTRDNGAILKIYPIYSQFNYVIVKVDLGSKYYLLDATDPLRPYDFLPDNILNVTGLIIKEGPAEWIAIKSDKKNHRNSLAVIKVNEDGTLTGTLEDSYSEYSSLNYRHKLQDKKDIDLAKEIFDTESFGINIDSVLVTGKDSIQSLLKIKSWITSESYTQKNGDMIYINPYIVHRNTENPFKSKIRNFPVDYAYKRGYTTIINLTIPEGYEVIEKLNDKSIFLENALSFVRHTMVDSNMIQIINKFEIKEHLINPRYYEKLKTFYTQMIASQAEQIVLGPKEMQKGNTLNNNPTEQGK